MSFSASVNSQYLFSASSQNLYGKYLRATFLKKEAILWFLATFICVALTTVSVAWLFPNAEYFMSDEFVYSSSSAGSFRRYCLSRALPIYFLVFPFIVAITLFAIIPLLPKGFEFGNHAWPRLYGWLCVRESRKKFIDQGRVFFNHFERHPMQVDVKRDRIIVYDEEGNQREVAFDAITQAFRGHSLLVLHVGSLSVPDDEIIIDYSQLPRKERSDFLWFIDSRLSAECKCYYFRKAKPDTKPTTRNGEAK